MSKLIIAALHAYKQMPTMLCNPQLKLHSDAIRELLQHRVNSIKKTNTLSVHDKIYELNFLNNTLDSCATIVTLDDDDVYFRKYDFGTLCYNVRSLW